MIKKFRLKFRNTAPYHLMLLPGVMILLIFRYIPMFGIIIAFQRFIPALGVFGPQKWIGLGNFEYLLNLPNSFQVFYNTLLIASAKIAFGMMVPILFSLLLNEVSKQSFKRIVQTIIYFPYFVSWVIFGGIAIDLLSPSTGIVNEIISIFGIEPIFFVGNPRWFRATLVATDVWKNFGFGTVIYLASITSIDPTLYEAASIDGAGRFQKMWHITIPGISMIIVLLMVLNIGNILNAGFEQVFNLYSPMVYRTGDIIDTFVYRLGILQSQFGVATAVGLFKSVVSFILISASYYVAYRFFSYRLF